MKRRSGITRSQRNIADMLRAAGRKVTVIDATRDPAVVEDERLRAAQQSQRSQQEIAAQPPPAISDLPVVAAGRTGNDPDYQGEENAE